MIERNASPLSGEIIERSEEMVVSLPLKKPKCRNSRSRPYQARGGLWGARGGSRSGPRLEFIRLRRINPERGRRAAVTGSMTSPKVVERFSRRFVMNFVVIGGDAAGMSAASRVKRNKPDAQVIVLEQTRDVSFSA